MWHFGQSAPFDKSPTLTDYRVWEIHQWGCSNVTVPTLRATFFFWWRTMVACDPRWHLYWIITLHATHSLTHRRVCAASQTLKPDIPFDISQPCHPCDHMSHTGGRWGGHTEEDSECIHWQNPAVTPFILHTVLFVYWILSSKKICASSRLCPRKPP